MVWIILRYVQIYPFVDGGGVCWNKWAPGEGVVVCAEINEGGGQCVHITYFAIILVRYYCGLSNLSDFSKKTWPYKLLVCGKGWKCLCNCVLPLPPFFCKKSKFANTCSRKLIFTHQMLQNFRTFCFANYVWNCSLPLINIFQTPHCFCILTFVINYSPVFVFKFIWNSPPLLYLK